MQTIRARLSLDHLFVLALGMTLAGLLTWLSVERLYLDTQRENLLAQARLMAVALQNASIPTESPQPYSQTANIMPGVHTRLLSEAGAVIVGLPTEDALTYTPAAEDYAAVPSTELVKRPEIASALRGTPATAVRRVLDHRRVLYAAAPVYSEDGQIRSVVYIATPLPSTGLPAPMIWQLLGAILLAVLLSALAGTVLARKIARPLEGLAGAAANISKGDLNQRVLMASNISEMDRLEQTFNTMAESLRRSDEAKKAFLADVTHELRTPLTVIKGTVETLEDGAVDDVEGRGALLASMARETERLIRLVNELLVLTRADAGALQLNLQPVDLAGMVRTRCEIFQGLATRQEIRLECRAGYQPDPQVRADPDRLAQVVDNLLDNAIRHSVRGSTITLAIRPAQEGMECAVSDEGTGIPAGHLPFIFERFYRVDGSRARRDGGTGLGLAIARALVNAHGGHISAQSIEGQGTTITFWLPKESDVS